MPRNSLLLPIFVLLFTTAGCGDDDAAPTPRPADSGDATTVADASPTGAAADEQTSPNPTSDPATDNPAVDEPTKTPEPAYQPVEVEFPADKPVKKWIAGLVDEDPKARGEASDKLDQLGPEGVTYLLAAIHDSDPTVRAGAAFGLLARLNVFDKRMGPALVAALDDSDPKVRAIAMRAVSSLAAENATQAIPALIKIVNNSSTPATTRSQAARTLALVGSDSRSLAALQKTLAEDTDREVRLAAIRAIPRVAPTPKNAVMALAPAISADSDVDCRRLVIATLAKYAEAAAPTAKQLVAALEDEPRVRTAAVSALSGIGKPAVPALVAGLDVDNVEARQAAITALGLIGRPARDGAADKLRALATTGDPKVRQAATAALARMGEEP